MQLRPSREEGVGSIRSSWRNRRRNSGYSSGKPPTVLPGLLLRGPYCHAPGLHPGRLRAGVGPWGNTVFLTFISVIIRSLAWSVVLLWTCSQPTNRGKRLPRERRSAKCLFRGWREIQHLIVKPKRAFLALAIEGRRHPDHGPLVRVDRCATSAGITPTPRPLPIAEMRENEEESDEAMLLAAANGGRAGHDLLRRERPGHNGAEFPPPPN